VTGLWADRTSARSVCETVQEFLAPRRPSW
jgi:hypothetical protein